MPDALLRVNRDWHGESYEFEPGTDGILDLDISGLIIYFPDLTPDDEILNLGPYQFLVVSKDYFGWKLILNDKNAAFRKYHYLIKRFFIDINRRLIATAQIWGLIEYKPGIKPEWSDLKVIQWLKK